MSPEQLESLILRLREEIAGLETVDSDNRDTLNQLLQQIEISLSLDSDSQSSNADLKNTLSETITQFEASHPRITAIINDILLTLSHLGI